jgi:hypothetical protein
MAKAGLAVSPGVQRQAKGMPVEDLAIGIPQGGSRT